MPVLGAGVVATDDDSVHGLLMLLDERGHGLAGVIPGSEGERVRVSWLQPDTVGAQKQPAGGNGLSAGLGGLSCTSCYGCILVVSSRSVVLCAW